MPKKNSSGKKSVTWQDTETLKTEKENSPKVRFSTPLVKLKFYSLPFHYIAIVYYLLYIEYPDLIKIDTIDYVLLKALPLTYFGQLLWLFLLPVQPGAPFTFAASILSVFSSIPIYSIAVLLGSPILAFQSQTLLFSLHLALLVTFPLLAVYQLKSKNWKSLIIEVSDLRFLVANPVFVTAFGSAIGGWAGVLTIPLDWDRDWQLYPISLVIGAYLGGFASSILVYLGSFL